MTSQEVPTLEKEEKDTLWLFDLALIIKLIDGTLEVIAAFFVLLVKPQFVLRIVQFATAGELAEDPNDYVANTLRTAAHTLVWHTQYLTAIYLALHGAVKIMLVIGILSGKRIAYPLFIGSLFIFGTYEAYRGITRHELLLEGLAIFDFMLMLFTLYEYKKRYPNQPLFR